MRLKHYIYSSLLLISVGLGYWIISGDNTEPFPLFKPTKARLSLPQTPVIAGNPICLEMSMNSTDPLELAPDLVWSSSYGTTIFSLDYENSYVSCFRIPKTYTQQAGTVAWQLVSERQVVDQGVITIHADTTKIGEIATYLGPRSITANPRDYTMLVSVPTDHYDNLLPEHTPVTLKKHYQDEITQTIYPITQGIVWQRIPAPLQSGRLSTSTTVDKQSGKELVVDIFPDLATPFTITATKMHSFADGNEQLTLKTSQIKDAYGNIIDDGTLIMFQIVNEQQQYWQTTGTTINGYAFAKALHPDTPSQWRIKAIIEGITESPEITIAFKSISTDFPVLLSENKREIIIGPFTSYLGQRLPDGIKVQLTTAANTKPIEAATVDGYIKYILPKAVYPKGTYDITIDALGIIKKQTIQLQ